MTPSATARALNALLHEGVGARAPFEADGGWEVRRAWPRKMDDPSAGLALELQARRADAEGRHARRGATWKRGKLTVLSSDPKLPALEGRVAAGQQVVGHRPGKRAVLRTAQGTFVKLARPSATLAALERMSEVERLLAGVPGAPALPQVASGWPTQGILELQPASGRPLDLTLPSDPAGEGRAVARLLLATASVTRAAHPRAHLPVHDLPAEAAVVQKWAATALASAPLTPAERTALEQDAPRVAARLRTQDPIGPHGEAGQHSEAGPSGARLEGFVLAHRDLHEGQILRHVSTSEEAGGTADRPTDAPGKGHGGVTTVLDWDTAAWAHPGADLANLLAHLRRLARLGELPREAEREFRRTLLAALVDGAHPALGDPAARRTLALLVHATELRLIAVHAFRRPL